ncbi:HEPN domain-containing protein [Dyadobacter chenhuakuii]|uniref:HEPN domain-containing protein n=1 Tax=Dyadobacter chenhuakuii TaxID=2909339 RepID=A0ABY4XKA7_9BACT|nr:HEPN domain-containing protein [Dyadobacter chenhuakuii]MCF2496411.1 HEPN domain-containing protein [Dyadobacter chenhuakuii]USJ30468.1 HEPN domain-containing protein [Dyadobacter chenhuakuii]
MKKIIIDDIVAKALECLTVAQQMLEKRQLDFVINRAYFTMYHSIQALLFIKNIRNKSRQKVHNAFHRELILTGELPQELGVILKKTFRKSQRADHEYDETPEQTAINSFNEAEYFVHSIVQYLKQNNHLK